MSSSGQSIWRRGLEGSQGSRHVIQPSTPPQLTRQIHSQSTAQDPSGGTTERVRASNAAEIVRLQITAIGREASKHI